MVATELSVASTRILALGSKLYPSNMPRTLSKDLTGLMQSLSRVNQRVRSIQPKFPEYRFGPTGKVSKKLVHLKRWTSFFETFPVGPVGILFEWIAPKIKQEKERLCWQPGV